MTLLDILAQKKVIDTGDISAIQTEALSSGQTIEQILNKRGINPAIILQASGEAHELPTRTLNGDVSSNALEYIPEESAIHYKVVPLGVKEGVLEVGIVDPDNIEARDALNFISSKIGLPYKVFLVSQEDFEKTLTAYQNIAGEVTDALSEFDDDKASTVQMSKGAGAADDKLDVSGKVAADTKIVEDAPVTKIVATILRYATEGNASDIHIEHMRDNVRVRFRVDGVLNTSLLLPAKVHSALTARIKILSNMRLDEKRKPQDGRFSAKIEGHKIDFRVSTFPTYYGEKIVMRILDQEKGVKGLEDLGFSDRNLELVRAAIKKPYGMILISGPTGSGKTSTLYSMLNVIDREQKNVLSLEDPIEYNIDGVSQSQIRPEIGYTFANGLRTTLRQDPNVIMVGEIRDKETAQLAVQAALTGHLVLSTIHTNNAVGVIPRLIDMGVDPYLIAPTLVLAMAQRLAGTLCEGTGKDIPVEDSVKMMIEKQFKDLPEEYRKEIEIPKAIKDIDPSPDCPTGIRGRVAVFEMFAMDKEVEKLILTNASELEIAKNVRQKGMLSMREDAMLKAFKGKIPFEEVNKL